MQLMPGWGKNRASRLILVLYITIAFNIEEKGMQLEWGITTCFPAWSATLSRLQWDVT
jgi:hypothetical protein